MHKLGARGGIGNFWWSMTARELKLRKFFFGFPTNGESFLGLHANRAHMWRKAGSLSSVVLTIQVNS